MEDPKPPPSPRKQAASFEALLERCLPIVIGVGRRQNWDPSSAAGRKASTSPRRSAAKRRLRKEQPPVAGGSDAGQHPGDPPDRTSGPSSRPAQRNDSDFLRAAIQALPEPVKAALRLHELIGVSDQEVAHRTTGTPKQARLRVRKAKLELARALNLLPEKPASVAFR